MKKILSVDLGGQSAKVAVFDETLTILHEFVVSTNLVDVANHLAKNIKLNLEELNVSIADISGMGIGVPGFISNNIIKLAGNLNFRDYDIVSDLKVHFPNMEIVLNNDANAAGLGEYVKGSGSNLSSAVFYVIGTGLGGCTIIDDKVISGANGFAGEFGHGGHFQDEVPCSCGLQHCVEPMSSGTGIERQLNIYADENINSETHQIKSKLGRELKLTDVSELAKAKDVEIVQVLEKSLLPLAKHISTMVFALNVEGVVLLGGPTNMGEVLSDVLEQLVRKYCLSFINDSFVIKIGSLKNKAGMYGNAHAVLNYLNR